MKSSWTLNTLSIMNNDKDFCEHFFLVMKKMRDKSFIDSTLTNERIKELMKETPIYKLKIIKETPVFQKYYMELFHFNKAERKEE